MLRSALLGRSRQMVVLLECRAGRLVDCRFASIACSKPPAVALPGASPWLQAHPRLPALALASRGLNTVSARSPPTTSLDSRSRRSQPDEQAPPPPLYPERLLIYHGGTGRTTFLACLRLSTLFVSIFFCLVVAPAYLRADAEEPLWKAGAVVLCGLVPLAFVLYSTSPFVAFVHLRLPPFARQSEALLRRYAAAPPDTACLEITTINLIGKPRVSRVSMSSIAPAKERFGLVNYVVLPDPARMHARSLRSTLSRPPSKFSIQQNHPRNAREGWVWDTVASAIFRRYSS